MPWHLMLCSGLYGIAVLGSRFAQAGPVRIAPRAPNPPRRMALTRTAAAIGVGIIVLAPWSAAALTITSLVISEVMVNPSGADDQREWVELYNGTGAAIDLIGYSLGWGGANYTDGGTLPLSGMIASGATFVIGGPLSDAGNGNPTYDLPIDFDGNLQNGGFFADGVALFDVPVGSIPATDPIDAVIYGIFNFNGLIDETGLPGPVDYLVGLRRGGREHRDHGWRLGQPAPAHTGHPPGGPHAAARNGDYLGHGSRDARHGSKARAPGPPPPLRDDRLSRTQAEAQAKRRARARLSPHPPHRASQQSSDWGSPLIEEG